MSQRLFYFFCLFQLDVHNARCLICDEALSHYLNNPFFAFLNVQGINKVCELVTPLVSTPWHQDTKIHNYYYYSFILAFLHITNPVTLDSIETFLCLLAKTCILKAHKLFNIAYTNSGQKNVVASFCNDLGEKRWIIVTHKHIDNNFYIHYHGLGSVTVFCLCCEEKPEKLKLPVMERNYN